MAKRQIRLRSAQEKDSGTAPFREVIIWQRWRICPIVKGHFGSSDGRELENHLDEEERSSVNRKNGNDSMSRSLAKHCSMMPRRPGREEKETADKSDCR